MIDRIEDIKLNIKTCGHNYSKMDKSNYGYDPTPYSVLKVLANSNLISKKDTLIDYGCGYGRVGFYLNNATGCSIIGIDHNPYCLQRANSNLKRYGNHADITFVNSKAELYDPSKGTCFYFFNPFSTRIFGRVLDNIIECTPAIDCGRKLFFFYPTEEHTSMLLSNSHLSVMRSLNCTTFFNRDEELYQILVFKII